MKTQSRADVAVLFFLQHCQGRSVTLNTTLSKPWSHSSSQQLSLCVKQEQALLAPWGTRHCIFPGVEENAAVQQIAPYKPDPTIKDRSQFTEFSDNLKKFTNKNSIFWLLLHRKLQPKRPHYTVQFYFQSQSLYIPSRYIFIFIGFFYSL